MNPTDHGAGSRPRAENDDAPVPLFGTWRRAYWTVVAALAAEVALLYFCTRYFS